MKCHDASAAAPFWMHAYKFSQSLWLQGEEVGGRTPVKRYPRYGSRYDEGLVDNLLGCGKPEQVGAIEYCNA